MKYIVSQNPILTPTLTKALLDNPITNTDAPKPKEAPVQQTVMTLLAVLLIAALSIWGIYQFHRSDPYVKNVLSLSGDPVQGQVIFQLNCAGCHGIDADGRVGPSLHHVSSRKSRVGIIQQVISGKTPPMPQFQPNPQEMADLLEYLEGL